MNGRLLELPSALVNAGLRVNVIGGWETRGRATMHPRGLVLHHTAAPVGRDAPSLRICIDGRSDLPGPLCHVLVGRDLTCHVIASGVAHHAGVGQWRGVSGNAAVVGVECENNGTTEPWSTGMVDVMVRISAACAAAFGFGSSMVCGHKEWAPRRKIDPHTLRMGDIRDRVATLLTPATPPPEVLGDSTLEDLTMARNVDVDRLVDEAYEAAGREPGSDRRGRAYWRFEIESPTKPTDTPHAIYAFMCDLLKLPA